MEQKAIFVKFYSIPFPNYKMTIIPGIKKGISGSFIVGYNIGISDAITEERKKASLEVVKYLTSKEIQKKYVVLGESISGINSLYYDEEVCAIVNCEAYKNVQPVVRKIDTYPFDNLEYDKKFTNFVYGYLFENKSISETIKGIEDITKIYKISLDTKDSSVGLTMFIILISVIVFMVMSLLLLYIKKYNIYFLSLSKDFWFVFMIGLTFLLCTGFTRMGNVTTFKCFLYPVFAIFGFSLTVIPFLHKMIVFFPEQNKISAWTEKHRYVFFLPFIVIDGILLLLFYFNGYDIKPVILNEGKHFEICQLKNIYGIVFLSLVVGYKLLITLLIIILGYVEWNISVIHMDIQCFISVIYIDILSLILLRITDLISIKSYILNFLIKVLIMMIVAIANYILLYGFQFFISFIKVKDEEIKLNINTVYGLGDNKNSSYYYSSNISSEVNNNTSNSNTEGSIKGNFSSKSSFMSKLEEYHKRKSVV